jgi:hypothetical protein
VPSNGKRGGAALPGKPAGAASIRPHHLPKAIHRLARPLLIRNMRDSVPTRASSSESATGLDRDRVQKR